MLCRTLIILALLVAASPLAIRAATDDEAAFRSAIEARKDKLLAAAVVKSPALTSPEQLALAKRNVQATEWGRKWFANQKSLADYLVSQPDSYIESIIPELTPTNHYGFTCPNCVGTKSQECAGASLYEWDYRNPEIIKCKACGQTYPDPKFPEEGKLECPRMSQTFTYYFNEAERQHPEDRTGKYAWHWVGRPMHVSFTGIVRFCKASFAVSSLNSLAYTYEITGDQRYAKTGIKMLERLTKCYRNWLYRDYWDTVADCDPMYAAWHDMDFPREWKRHPCEDAFKGDKPNRASMLRNYWGAGRLHPSTDIITYLASVSGAYDTFHKAMTTEQQTLVARDLLLEWLIGAEPFIGGEGKTENVSNKSPRIYLAMATVGKCLGIPDFMDTALRGYEEIRDQSFIYDGMSSESPAYTVMYLSPLLPLVETLQGYCWPGSFEKRKGTVDLYGTDSRLRLMFRSIRDQLDGAGYCLPLSDTMVQQRPGADMVETGVKRYPEYFENTLYAIFGNESPTDYAVYNLAANDFAKKGPLSLPEILYPAWMTAIMRSGDDANAPVLAFVLNPPGGHRHSDNLGIYYQDRGLPILAELGYVGDMPTKEWAGSTLSHNLVVVDDTAQSLKVRTPTFRYMATSPKVSVIEASSDCYKQCTDYRRLAALVKGPNGQTFVIDIFRVNGGKKHAFQVLSGVASSDATNSTLAFEGLTMPTEPPLPNYKNSIEHDDIYGLRDTRTDSAPPHAWQATWQQSDRSYRLWMLSKVDRIEASNGPYQTTRFNAGRRARYLNAIREGNDLSSVFVAIHEPSGTKGMPIKRVVRLDVPTQAGPNAVALKIESDWGTFYVFNEFDQETNIEGIAFQGKFGVICDPPKGKSWLMAVGASALKQGKLGFSGKTAQWTGSIAGNTESAFTPSTGKPTDWPSFPKGCQSYIAIDTEKYRTGFAASDIDSNHIRVERFPLPASCRSFDWLALRYEE